MKRSELVRALASIPPFPNASAGSEQVTTPPEIAADLLFDAVAREDLVGRSVLDLGSGTGVLAIGSALLGAASVVAVEHDAAAMAIAVAAAEGVGARIEWVEGPVELARDPVDTVVMNPPFGAQKKHADRAFWSVARALARRRIYAFALSESRTFIARWAVAHGAQIEATRPVAWPLHRTFPHHRKRSVELAVDRWVLTTGTAQ